MRTKPFCVLLAGIALVQAVASARPPDRRVAEYADFANRTVRQLGGYRSQSVALITGTVRGGEVTGYYDGNALKALTASIRMSARDDVTRYFFRDGRTVVIDLINIPLDPTGKTLLRDKRRLRARYLLISVGTRYVIHGPTERFQPITDQERLMLDDLVYNLRKYRALLSSRY